MTERYLIVGLGNPGKKYEQTRHNVGFWVIDELAQRYGLTQFTSERKALTADGLIKGKRVTLAKPQTYMNLSGEAVRALMDFYKLDVAQIIIVHDDLDTDFGALRLRKTGGHGGQNGVRNIIKHVGNKEFARVRFGIGRPAGKMQAVDYVLQKFHGDDAILAQQVTERAADALEVWLQEGIDVAMSRYNGDINEPQPNPEPDPAEQLTIAERAHELNPHDPKPLEKLAGLYKRLRRLDDAANAHLKLAAIHAANDKSKAALSELERAVAMRPMLTDVQERLARGYEEHGNSKRAVGRWIKLAEYYEQQGDQAGMVLALDEALRVNPQHPKALAMREKSAT
jgi:peptidyl-tRNA hydrolase, PTH1 family